MIEILVITAFFVILYWKTISLFRYTLQCFDNIIEDETIQKYYKMSVDGSIINNVRKSWIGVMYLYVVVPQDVNKQDYGSYLVQHLRLIDESLQVQNLYGLVRSSYESFSSVDDGKEQTIFLVKFVPIIYGASVWKFCLLLIFTIALFFRKEITDFVWHTL